MIKIQAAQLSTGIILDEQFEWFTKEPNQKPFELCFDSQEDALGYCKAELLKLEDIEFVMTKENGETERIINL